MSLTPTADGGWWRPHRDVSPFFLEQAIIMAARKSCTKLTWAEAKARVGESSGVIKKKGEKPKKLSHVEKVIAKQTGVSTKEEVKLQKSLDKQAQRQEQKLMELATRRAQERKEMLEIPDVSPFEQASQRMKQVADERTKQEPSIITNVENEKDIQTVVRNKELQLNEILALEAIFADSDEFVMCAASRLEDLRKLMEEYQAAEQEEEVAFRIANHPALSFVLQLAINDEEQRFFSDGSISASLLLHVTLPRGYPESLPPQVEVAYFCCTDREQQVKADKVLESLAHLDEGKLLQDLQQECQQMLPDLCIYEACVTWLSEHLFGYLTPTHELILQSRKN
jgi:hypothetical protein